MTSSHHACQGAHMLQWPEGPRGLMRELANRQRKPVQFGSGSGSGTKSESLIADQQRCGEYVPGPCRHESR